jgi:hypothetical protein
MKLTKKINKICTECNEKLPANNNYFGYQKNGKYSLRSKCKECNKKYLAKYRSTYESKERHRLYMIKYRKENPLKSKEVANRSRDKHKEKINKNRREKYLNDPTFKQKCIAIEKKYKESGRRREVNSTPECLKKGRIRNANKRKNKDYREKEYLKNEVYRKENKEKLHKMHFENRLNLIPSYVAQSMGISVKDLTPEIYETKKIIIQLKRELKNNNIKIR